MCASLLGSPTEAQPLQAGAAGNWTSTWSEGRPISGLLQSLWVDRRGIGASLGGNLCFDLDGEREIEAQEDARSLGFVLELAARGAGTALTGPRGGAGSLSARLHWARHRSGAWLAASGFQVDHTRGMLPVLGAGAWHERGRFTFATQLVHLVNPLRTSRPRPAESPTDTSRFGVDPREVSTAGEDVRLMTGAETSVTWGMERVELLSRTGFAVGVHHQPAYWGELSATYWARRQFGIFGRVRSTTRVPARLEVTTETNAALGVQFALGQAPETQISLRRAEPDFCIRALGDSRYRIVLRVRGRQLEVTSDANDWTPLAATRLADDRWEVELVLSPGVHRIAIKVDGAPWRAPPGLPSTFDEFGGEVGLLVVE